MTGALTPFRNRSFLFLWLGLALTLVAAGMWMVALPLIAIQLGYSGSTVGAIVGCGLIGMLASLLFAGVIADRMPKRRVLFGASIVPAVIVGIAFVTQLGMGMPAWVLALAAFLVGMGDGVYGPTNEAILPELLEKEHLQAGNSAQAVVESLLYKAFGPALGGAALYVLGINGTLAVVSVLLLLVALVTFAIEEVPPATTSAPGWFAVFGDIREGVGFVASTRWVWTAIIWSALALLLQAGPRSVGLPVLFGQDGASHFATIMVAYGLAAAAGSFIAGVLPTPTNQLRRLFVVWSLGSVPLVALGIAPELHVAYVAMALVGFFNAIGNVTWSTVMQARVPDGLRGRVASVDWFGSVSLMPVSTVLAGLAVGHGRLNTLYLLAGSVPVILAIVFYAAARGGDADSAVAAAEAGHDTITR